MQRDIPDVFRVLPDHEAIHGRLLNWAAWVSVRPPRWVHPMWRKSILDPHQHVERQPRREYLLLKAQDMEKAVGMLPVKHRHALRWWYVYRYGELKVRRELGVTSEALVKLLHDARCMLINRGN